jgi:putative ABC transport system permease protein
MRISNIAHLYLVRLKARVVLVQELFAVLGIAVGVALLFASQVASTSLNKSVTELTKGVVGQATYQLKARGPSGFDEALVGQVQRMPGVRAVVPVLESPASVTGPRGSQSVDLVATDPHYVHLAGTLLQHFSASQLAHTRVLALPAPIARHIGAGPLEVVKLQVGAHVVHALVGLELTSQSIGALANNPIALAPLAYAQRLTGLHGRITRLLVQVRPGAQSYVHAELVRLAGGHLNVEPADYDATLFHQAAAPVNQSTQTFAAICALVGFMFAYCSMLLTVDLRRGLVRELRRGGATRGETVKTLLFDAFVLATVAAVLGLALGDLLSILAFSSPPGFLAFAFPIGAQRIVTWQSVALAVGASAVAACVGVLLPLSGIWRHQGRRRAIGGPHAHRSSIPRVLMGACACLMGTAIILFVAPRLAVVGVIFLIGAVGVALLIGAMILLLPPALDMAIVGFARLQHTRGNGATALAIVQLRSPATHSRSVAIGATAAVAVFGSITILGSRANLQNGLDQVARDTNGISELWIAPREEQDLLLTTPFAGVPPTKFERLPSVGSVGEYRAGFLDYGGRRVWVFAPPVTASSPIPPSQVVAGNLTAANARVRAGGWAAISKTLASQHDLKIGQAFTLPASKEMILKVAALITNLGWPPGAIVLNEQDYVSAWQSDDPSAYTVAPARGVSVGRAQRALTTALGPRSGLAVETSEQREQKQRTAGSQGLGRLTGIALLVLLAGVLATATVMGAMIWQRRRQFARMKVQGYEQKVLWMSLLWESGLLIGVGCLLGAVLGMLGQLLLSHALREVTGFPVVISSNVTIVIAAFLVVTVAAGACVAVPGYRAADIEAYPWPNV